MTRTFQANWLWGPYSGNAFLLAAATLIIDQLNKWWLVYIYNLPEKGEVALTPFFNLVMVWNRGIGYGLFQQDDMAGRIALIIFALLAIIGLTIWLARTDALLPALSFGLIIGGAAGNAIDRAIYGAVADFYSLHAFGFYWYVFNIADMAIVAGVAGLLYDSLFVSRKKVSNMP